MEEQWKPVVGYEGMYEVSNRGKVRSIDRVTISGNRYGGTHKRVSKGKMLSLSNNDGYQTVILYNNKMDRKKQTPHVHTLVARAFLEKPEWADRVNHKDFNRSNNNVDNLEWVDHTENIRHAVRNGHSMGVKGEKNYNSRLTEEDVRFIRKNAKTKGGTLTSTELSEMFGIQPSAIRSVVNGYTWKHVK